MRHIKVFGLTAIAAVLAAALIGASTASAVSLCKVEGKKCAAGNLYPAGQVIKGTLKTGTIAKLETSLGNVECKESASEGQTEVASGNPLNGKITALSFKKCTLGFFTCTVTVEGLPYAASITSKGTGTKDGTFTAKNGKAFVDCGGEALECFVVAETAALEAFGGTPGTLKANGIAFKLEKGKSGFLCPETSKWVAEYTISPSPIFVTAEP